MNEDGHGEMIEGYSTQYGDAKDGWGEWAMIRKFPDGRYILRACQESLIKPVSAYIPIKHCPMCGKELK
jgi:hypothetical protein